jgi:hypothetical protein
VSRREPTRVISRSDEYGNLMRRALAYTPDLDQKAALQRLVRRHRERTFTHRRTSLVLAFSACFLAFTLVVLVSRPEPRPARTSPDATPALRQLPTGRSALSDGTSVDVAPESAARLETTSNGERVTLERGSVTLTVTRQAPGRTLEVLSRSYRFVALGTVFAVSTSDERVVLTVREGRVGVYRDSSLVTELSAGGSWSADATVRPLASGKAPTPHPIRSPAPSARPTSSSTERDCLAFARAGDAREAERCYRSQSEGIGLRAELALFELARLESDVLGDPNRALEVLEQYQLRFPSGSLRAEVDLSHVHLLSRLGRHHEVLVQSEKLLRSGSASERRAELQLLRGNTLREGLGDCARAEREYAAVEQTGGRFAAEASYFRGVCLEAVGNGAAAAASYRRYLSAPGRPREAEARRRLGEIAP